MIGTLIARRSVAAGREAFNRRDLDAYLENWAEDVHLVYPGDIPDVSGVHKGKAAIWDFYERDFEQFPSLNIRLNHVGIKNLFDLTGNNVIILNWEADATNRDGFRIQNSGVNVMTVAGGKVTHVHTYIFDTGEKFRAAWGMPPRPRTWPRRPSSGSPGPGSPSSSSMGGSVPGFARWS